MEDAIDVIVIAAMIAISSGTVGAIFKTVYDRVCKKHDKRDEILKQLKQQAIDISQLKITSLIYNTPEDRHAIISECEHYFYDLKGNSWVFGFVDDWAKKEGVNISYLRTAYEKNEKMRKEK